MPLSETVQISLLESNKLNLNGHNIKDSDVEDLVEELKKMPNLTSFDQVYL